ncbi:MAG TPA: APC family permease [Burkholderiales bacterium]|nr:APC family permease [Burkholderiales bacterium]
MPGLEEVQTTIGREDPKATLRRSLSLPLITFYGLGTILGAGIYVLVGKVAGVAGMYAPISFTLAAVIAGLSAFTYMELCSRHPLAGGAAVYAQQGFGVRWLSILVGFLIVLSGLVSAATISKGFVGYFRVFIELPDVLIIVTVVVALALLAAWGIAQSVAAAAVATVIEVGGLILIIAVASASFGALPERLPELIPSFELVAWEGIFLGGFLAFYAFIGFEDMANVAEEVKDPIRSMPRAILLAIAISTLLYLAVSLAAVLAVPMDELTASRAPLALMFERSTGTSPKVMALISLFAVINGALIQIIMAARMLYGMSREGWLPKGIGEVNSRTHTPIFATALVSIGVLVLALALPLVTLAKVTSFAVLAVFALLGLALARMKRAGPPAHGVYTVPAWVPYASTVSAVALLGLQVYDLLR